ncbi:MAG: response regulator [Gammaproteobacteria bacterium]|nr:response regulator [Gammaproteobacteria bacterium]
MSGALPRLRGRVLVAHPAAAVVERLSAQARQLGAEVLAVRYGQAAVELALDQYPELVWLDRELPGVPGEEAASLLREMGFGQPIGIFAAEGSADAARARDAGFAVASAALDASQWQALLRQYLPPAQARLEETPLTPRMQALIQEFEAQVPQTLAEISERLLAEDWERLQQIVHKLKGCAGSLGHPTLTAQAQAMLAGIHERNLFEASARYGDMACYVRDRISRP